MPDFEDQIRTRLLQMRSGEARTAYYSFRDECFMPESFVPRTYEDFSALLPQSENVQAAFASRVYAGEDPAAVCLDMLNRILISRALSSYGGEHGTA